MDQSMLTGLLATLDFLVLEWLGDQDFRQLGDTPSWFPNFDLAMALSRQRFTLDSELPFLDNFLIDATRLWAEPQGWVSSGPWMETDREGHEAALEATAVSIGDRKILLIRHGPAQFREKQRIVQRGRELSLEYGRLQRWEQELVHRQHQLEEAVAARTAELGASRDELVAELAERRKVQDSLHEEEERFRLLIEECPFGILWRRSGRPAYINPSFSEIFNCRLEEIVDSPWPLQEVAPALENPGTANRTPIPIVSRVITREGFQKIVRCHHIAVGAKDEFLFIEDISDQKRMEDQLAEAQKMEVVGTLAGGIAHDFNNLLQAIQGYAELLLLDRQPSDRDYEDVREIVQAATRGRELTRQLLTMSRRLESRQELVDPNEMARRAHRLLGRTLPKMIEVNLSLADDLGLIRGDPSQLEQVLMNLAVNARDAMPEGGRLTLETARVTVPGDGLAESLDLRTGEYVRVTVADTGTGIDEATQSRMFEPFFTTKEVGKGTGLGLAIVYGIVKSHQGWIACESSSTEGTRFHILLPRLAGSLVKRGADRDAFRGSGHERILLVEDDEALRRLGEGILRRFGYKVVSEPDAERALDRFRKEHDSIDLVLLDLIMPGMGGQKCLDELLKFDPGALVVIASGLAEGRSTEELTPAKGFVAKPYRVSELLETVRRVLDSAQTS